MLMKVSQWFISFLFPDIEDKDQRDLCIYGCELWLYTIISTFGLLIIGILMHATLESAIIIVIFYLCQSSGGGYHASSHLSCFFTMVAGLLGCLLIPFFPSARQVLPFLCAASFLVLLAIPLRLHPNKKYLEARKRSLCMRSILVTTAIAFVIIAMDYSEGDRLFYCSCSAVCLSALSRLCATKIDKVQ